MNGPAPRTHTIATVGTFDGVHRGHVYLLEQLRRKASELGLASRVFPFPEKPAPGGAAAPAGILTSTDEKLGLLRQHADEVSLLELSTADFRLTARDFLRRLKENYGVEAFMMGFNNHIGSDRASASDLQGSACIPVYEAAPLDGGISSTAVRLALAEGRIADAAAILGRPYSLRGTVVGGKRLGRTIGFPTANIEPDSARRTVPATGVYAATVAIDGHSTPYPAVANIGHRPTVDATGAPLSIEAHILDFDGDIYGRAITLTFTERLRAEQRFGSLDELREAIEADCRRVREGSLQSQS